MDLDTLIVAVYCEIDDGLGAVLGGRRLRRRGPAPVLADSEVLTMAVVGEFLGLDQDRALYGYFRRHWGHYFPALTRVHRTTVARQAADLWAVMERLWQRVVRTVPHEDGFAVVDSFPLPVCRFARADRCRRFRGEAAFGPDELVRPLFYGYRVHVRLCWPGVVARIVLAPANVAEPAAVPLLAGGTSGLLRGDRNYWYPRLAHEPELRGVRLLAPYRWASRDPWPARTALLSRFRYRIDTVFGQLAERFRAKTVWARDPWHLWGRLLRKVLSHTLAVLLNTRRGDPPLQLAALAT